MVVATTKGQTAYDKKTSKAFKAKIAPGPYGPAGYVIIYYLLIKLYDIMILLLLLSAFLSHFWLLATS